MCGIIAVVRRPEIRQAPAPEEVSGAVANALLRARSLTTQDPLEKLSEIAQLLETAGTALRGAAGARTLLDNPSLAATLRLEIVEIEERVATLEAQLDEGLVAANDRLELLNAAIIRLKDAAWAIRGDRLRSLDTVVALGGAELGDAGLGGYLSIVAALSAIDRMEVRGRDSAGVEIIISNPGLDTTDPSVNSQLAQRSTSDAFVSGTVRVLPNAVAFVYKVAAEIGELGDNTRVLREQIRRDDLLKLALNGTSATALVLAHTRWAAVGVVSEPNAHPLDSIEVGATDRPFVSIVANGDIDNFADLKATDALNIPAEITTDAKVAPVLMSRRMAEGVATTEAFRDSVERLEGSVAVAAAAEGDFSRLYVALRGSGQGVYVGLADEAFIVASEPYGVIEEASSYLRMDGDTPADAANPGSSRGQILVLDAALAGQVEGISRTSFSGAELPIAPDEIVSPGITTRDIDRGENAHFLLKELGEAPASFRRTLRGKLVANQDGLLEVRLSPTTFPQQIRDDLASGKIQRLIAIGQGTASVAGTALAAVLADLVAESTFRVESTLATELSGFGLRPDMSDTLIVAISQSGTTTDTNRTVDLARARGARVLSIVNRRSSDLTDKSDGVLYTSDGRDIEISVASTKAFYAQIAASFLLATAIAQELGVSQQDDEAQEILRSLRDLPDAMTTTLALRENIGRIAARVAPPRRYWAVVGNGRNLIAAKEVRIKLSELCYKAIACDSTEDKKHIDLSSEPMVLVCATGLSTSNMDDVAKEVAIYRTHKASPVVITTDADRFGSTPDVIGLPAVHPSLGFILAAMAGHLFGYEAALAIDALAKPLREARASVEELLSTESDVDKLFASLREVLVAPSTRFFDGVRSGEYDGHLESSMAVRVASLLRFATGVFPLDTYELEQGKVGTPVVLVEDLMEGLTRAIEELTRPVDAIRHQAKTVTVGISRSDESLLEVPLVRSVVEAGAPRDRLPYTALKVLADLDQAVDEVLGYTRYAIDGVPGGEGDLAATITVVDKGGIARDIPSRVERNPRLVGTKHQVAAERSVYVNVGRSDGRTTVLVPEIKGNQTTGMTLVHVLLHDTVDEHVARHVLMGYRGRYGALRDAVMETEPTFRDDLLSTVPVVELLTSPIQNLADRWRSNAGA